MEYDEGPTLEEELTDGPLQVTRAVNILLQVADALGAAHAQDVVHRDLKPKNVVLTTHRGQPDYVKILDFGLAKIVGIGATSGLTGDGETVGTPEYMSPEQIRGSDLDQRTDIYSFGILAYEMLVGVVPFPGPVVTKVITAHLHKKPSSPSAASGRKDIPPAVDSIVLRCLAKRPEDRYACAADLHADLDQLKKGKSSSSSDARKSDRLRTQLSADSGLANVPTEVTPPLFPADKDHQPPKPDQRQPAMEDESTESDWPELAEVERRSKRSRALEELACAVRDQGIGSMEISDVLSRKLQSEDSVIEVESELTVMESSAHEIEMTARERESRLRQALNQLEHERAILSPVVGAPESESAKAERESKVKRLDDRANEITEKIQRISQRMEQEIKVLKEDLERKRRTLEGLCREVDQHEQQLAELLGQIKSQILELSDPELKHLVAEARI
jgi:serine/threonine protein kinase